MWVPLHSTVDHFEPKSLRPDLAYQWGNFRLADEKLNYYKADSTGLLDPFYIQPGWFLLDFTTFLVKAGTGLRPEVEVQVVNTISVLRLNEDSLVQFRFSIAKEYALGQLPLDFVERYYPFIAFELRRQNLTETIRGSFGS